MEILSKNSAFRTYCDWSSSYSNYFSYWLSKGSA